MDAITLTALAGLAAGGFAILAHIAEAIERRELQRNRARAIRRIYFG